MIDLINKINNSEGTKEDLKLLYDKMHTKETRKLIESLCNDTTENAEKVYELVSAAQILYENTDKDTGMSDTEYDILYEKLTNDFINQYDMNISARMVGNNIKTGHHKYTSLRGTLDKIYSLSDSDQMANKSRRSLDDFINTSERKILSTSGKSVNLIDEDIYVFPKFDGLSCVFEFSKDGKLQRALTRGDTSINEAQDVTHIFKDWVTGPFKNFHHDYGIKTEIMMSNKDFDTFNETYKTNYKNSRSAVASIMNSDTVDEKVTFLTIISLRMSYIDDNGEESLQTLTPQAFDVPHIKCKLGEIKKIEEFAETHHYVGKDQLRCDGAVIYIINPEIQKILGRENEKQKFEVAYKFTEESAYSKIQNIEFRVGLFGSIAPVATIKPVKLKGNTIRDISLGSMGRFKKLNLAKGDKVKILYDIIPYLLYDEEDPECKRSHNEPFKAPDRCPECSMELIWSESGDGLSCTNPNCPCRIKGKILVYLNKMNISGISYATIDDFYEEGYLKTIEDIYKLKKHKKELEKIPGYGKTSIKAILDEIENHRECSYSQLLGAIGIKDVSIKTFIKILKIFSYDEVIELALNNNYDAFIIVNGIKTKTAEKIVNGIQENRKLLKFLESELILHEEKRDIDRFSVCFTKIRDKEMEEFIQSLGGSVSNSITKNTDLLVVPMLGTMSDKVGKAQKYNIPIIDIDHLQEYLMKNYKKE